MIRFFLAILVLYHLPTAFSQINDDYDCDVPPPLSVEPLTCCRVSKPFDRINFPECFPIVKPTLPPLPPLPSSPSIIVLSTSTSRPIPVSEDSKDDYVTPTSRRSYHKYTTTTTTDRPVYKERYNESDSKFNDQKSDGGKHHDYEHHWPGKYHWGYHDNHRHFYSDYHRFGRHRRQAIYRINAPSPYPCAIECIFNQTNILTNGRFDRDIALDVYADYYPEIPIDLLTRTIDRCTRQLRNYQIARRRRNRNQIKRNNGAPSTTKRCRNGSGLFAACFNREIYRNCPTELDTDSDDCTSLRSFIDSCSPIRAARLNFSYDSVDVDENGNYISQDN